MKLYWAPVSCAMEIAALLEEAGASFELEKVDTRAGAHRKEPFTTMNPKGKLPVLVRDDGRVITEYPTIAYWIARTYPAAHLVPTDPEAELAASEMMEYVVANLHGQGFRRIFFPQEFCKEEVHRDAVKADGKAIVQEGFAILSHQLGDRPFAGGDTFSIADATIFYVTRWAGLVKIELPANIAALGDRVKARPAFQAAFARLV